MERRLEWARWMMVVGSGDGSRNASSNRDASGRRFHGNDLDCPTSKYSATISPPSCSMTWRERASCQLRDEVASCWSSVLTRP
jgi:hypothetical protein